MRWFWQKKKEADPPPPEALNLRHTFVNPKPGSNTVLTIYPTAQPAGKATYATGIGDGIGDLPILADQIAIRRWDRVPDGMDPRIYWARREADELSRHRVERTYGLPQQEIASTPSVRGPDPKWTPPPVNRRTDDLIPVNGHGTWNPWFGNQFAHRLNGFHGSMALVHRNYPIGGMSPMERHRNTLRVIPPSHDATSADVDSFTNYSTPGGIYHSPGSNIPGVSYGLRGGY